MSSKIIKIGLTGSLGSGKSQVLDLFKLLGCDVLNSDELAHEILATDTEVLSAISEKWGPTVFQGNIIDRKALAEAVFSSEVPKNNLAWLEDLLHPKVIARWEKFFKQKEEQSNQSDSDASIIIVEVPLLFEKKLQHHFQKTINISVDREVRIQRLLKKGFTEKRIFQIAECQFLSAEKNTLADWVILNDGSSDFLKQQVSWLIEKIKTLI